MANTFEPTHEQERLYNEWLSARPAAIQEVASRFVPWKLYRMKSTGQRVTVYSFSEGKSGITLTVNITGQFNAIAYDRSVFGIDPDDLEECDLPSPGEPVGAAMTQEQVEENLDEIRLAVRPDLWQKMPDGRLMRKDTN